jgi:predicted transcriptional regulator
MLRSRGAGAKLAAVFHSGLQATRSRRERRGVCVASCCALAKDTRVQHMSDIGKVLKEEIRRLARSEVRRETSVLRKASAQYRRDIAALKRELEETRKRLRIAESESRHAREVGNVADLEGRRFSAKGLRSHRERLGLSASDYGKLLGVSGQTIYHWEQGKARPTGDNFARLIELRKLGKRAALARLESIPE